VEALHPSLGSRGRYGGRNHRRIPGRGAHRLLPPKLSTDLRVDDQRRIYYEVVNDRTGDVVYEIPPEAIRKLGESLNVSLDVGSSGHRVDVKS